MDNMTTKQKIGCLFSGLRLLIITPIWYYLIFSILKLVNASEIMWILFWIYVPAHFIMAFIEIMVASIFEESK